MLSLYNKRTKDFFKNSYFALQLPAFLIDTCGVVTARLEPDVFSDTCGVSLPHRRKASPSGVWSPTSSGTPAVSFPHVWSPMSSRKNTLTSRKTPGMLKKLNPPQKQILTYPRRQSLSYTWVSPPETSHHTICSLSCCQGQRRYPCHSCCESVDQSLA